MLKLRQDIYYLYILLLYYKISLMAFKDKDYGIYINVEKIYRLFHIIIKLSKIISS